MTIIQLLIDIGAWLGALGLFTALRYEFDVTQPWSDFAVFAVIAAVAQAGAGYAFGLYRGRWRYGSFEEVAGLARAVGTVSLGLFLIDEVVRVPHLVPATTPIGGGFIALVLMGAVRYARRLGTERRNRPSHDEADRIIVFGAGEGGAQVVSAMLRDPQSPYIPVALLDDDYAKRNLRIMNVPVMGSRDRIATVAAKLDVKTVLLAIPSADSSTIGPLSQMVLDAGLAVKVLPSTRELFGETVGLADIRDVTPADLLGRHVIRTDLAAIAGYLTGRKVLVTGAGGSIGSELCYQLNQFAPSELIMVDRDESGLHGAKLRIDGRALLDGPDTELVCIRDREAVRRLMARRRPDVIFHAAALKHLPMLERFPGEALLTNVIGTQNLLEAAAEVGVSRFVNISTDKAADPISVLGHTKRLAERLTAWMSEHSNGTYLSVRFGNVLGSRGSVLTSFQAQIAAGGPVTVTHPDVTRYFMTVEEAVELVVQAGAIGRSGEALVLDMGEPVRIDDVARFLAARSERPVQVVYTGLRDGEKLHEDLLGTQEIDSRPFHPLISHVTVPPLDPSLATTIDPALPASDLIETLAALASTAIPF